MLTSLFQALVAQLSSLGLPVYLADCVPQSATFPYITAEIAAPLTSGGAGSLTLTIWCSADSPHADRLGQTDELLTYLPARGMRLEMDDIAVTLQHSGASSCVDEKGLKGLRTVWTLRCFPA